MEPRAHALGYAMAPLTGLTDLRLSIAILVLLVVPSSTMAGGSLQPRVRIPNYAEVQGETIRLSDLLPPDSPAELEQLGARIILGGSPLPASQRVISRDQIEVHLREFPSLREKLELPEKLTVFCRQRRLEPDEIRTAIEAFLSAEGLTSARAALRNSLSNRAPVLVTARDPGLVVKRMEPDRVRRQIRFLLWTSNEPQVLPFYVSVEEPPEVAAGASLDRMESGAGAGLGALLDGKRPVMPAPKAGNATQARAPAIILVAKGKPAKLVVEADALRMTALVTPLESGAKGQLIRVKNPDTQRVIEAEVVGEGLLHAVVAGE